MCDLFELIRIISVTKRMRLCTKQDKRDGAVHVGARTSYEVASRKY